MSYQGYAPTLSPLTPGQVRPVADQLYRRIDGTNMPLDTFKNALINGSFDWYQRGLNTVGVGYLADRWRLELGNSNGLQKPQAIDAGAIPSESSNGHLVIITPAASPGAGDYAVFRQTIEGVRRFAGKRVVVRGRALRTGGTGNMFVDMEQSFGSGGSSPAYATGQTVQLSSQWVSFAVPLDIPSIVGKTIGTGDGLILTFWFSCGSVWNSRTNNLGLQSINVVLADLEVKEVLPGYGDQAPPFERVPKEIDLLRCLRYFQRVPAQAVKGNASQSNVVNRMSGLLMTPMRTAPSITANGLIGYDGVITVGLTPSNSYSTATAIDFDASPASAIRQYASVIGVAGTIDASAEF